MTKITRMKEYKEPLQSADIKIELLIPIKGRLHVMKDYWEVARAIYPHYEIVSIDETSRVYYTKEDNMMRQVLMYRATLRVPNPCTFKESLNKLQTVMNTIGKELKANYMYVVHPSGIVEKLCATE